MAIERERNQAQPDGDPGDREATGATQGADDQRPEGNRTRPRGGAGANSDIEAMNTDGRGTGGVGDDLGGYGPVRGSDATG